MDERAKPAQEPREMLVVPGVAERARDAVLVPPEYSIEWPDLLLGLGA